jgi:ATP-dependent Clp protease ATP-binding subunit ClpB
MRIDRLTSKLLALSDAQSLAVGHDHPAIEPAHLMQALLEQQGGSIKPLLMQVGFDINSLRKELTKELDQLPKIQNPTGDVNMSQDLARLLNRPTAWPSRRATSSSPASWCCSPPWTRTASSASCCSARA